MCAGWGIRCGITKRIFWGDRMPQVGEGVAFGIVLGNDSTCPFDHSTHKKPPKVKNEFAGSASTLAENMKDQCSIYLHTPLKPNPPPKSVLNPHKDPGSKFFWELKRTKWPVTIKWEDLGPPYKSGELKYRVKFAAHHLIPAQASLKPAKLLHSFMIYKHGEQAVLVHKKEGKGSITKTLPGGVVRSNVGYDVNGSENGVFLPGNYAVTKITLAKRLWTPAPSVLDAVPSLAEDEDDDHDGENYDIENTLAGADSEVESDDPVRTESEFLLPADPSSRYLTGYRHQIDDQNRKWQYVKQAMQSGGQFHDAHTNYNVFVLGVLQKIGSEYWQRVGPDLKPACPKCEEVWVSDDKEGIPTPYALVRRLEGVSRRLRVFVSGGIWCEKLTTSRWGQAYVRSAEFEK